MPIPNAPSSPFNIPIVTCSICRNEQTVARSANSYTLQLWHVINYPSDCHCPKCSSIKKTPPPPPPEAEPPPKKPITKRNRSISARYYQVAEQLVEFTTSDIKAHDLPNTYRAGSYIWSLVNTGKLIKIGPARFKIAPTEPPRTRERPKDQKS